MRSASGTIEYHQEEKGQRAKSVFDNVFVSGFPQKKPVASGRRKDRGQSKSNSFRKSESDSRYCRYKAKP